MASPPPTADTPASRLSFPANPGYGSGVTRRRIRLIGTPGMVQSVLVDTFHEMRCTLRHADGRITAIDGESLRVPTTACPTAAGILKELVGLPIDIPAVELYGGGRPARNCTHLFDLAALTIAHAGRGSVDRVCEAAVPDEADAPAEITITIDNEVVHRWHVRDGIILGPSALNGRPITRGFAAWATQKFEGDALEAATILSRTYLISFGARVLHEAGDGQPTASQPAMIGACYAYAPERAHLALFHAGNRRNFDAGIVERPQEGGPNRG